ncbi:MAG: hypothetical protein IPQ24_05760 [Anaeromyxobacter sp.]|nr:hypothetical protein [Anaeromyxobacter sp.]
MLLLVLAGWPWVGGAATPTATSTSASAPTATATPPPLPQASPKAVASRLSKATPRLGEPFTWELEIRHGQAESYALPEAPALAPFELRSQGCTRAAAGEDSLTTCTLTLALYELGAHDLPALSLAAATPAGPRVLDVPGPRVEASGLIDPAAPTDALELRAPAPPVPLVLPSWRVVWWALGALAAALAGWLLWRWWRRARAPPPSPPRRCRPRCASPAASTPWRPSGSPSRAGPASSSSGSPRRCASTWARSPA